MRYLLLNVGCLECGEPTEAMALFKTMEELRGYLPVIGEDREKKLITIGIGEDPDDDDWSYWHGQSVYVVVDLGETDA